MNKKNYPQRKKLETKFKNRIGYGSFFVTMVCLHRKPIFGRIDKEEVLLSEIGWTVEEIWKGLPNYYFQIKLGEYILMPNHFHGIITIREMKGSRSISLSQIMHSFKTKSTFEYHKFQKEHGVKRYENLWQRGYIEKWIPLGGALSRIEKYIQNNPKKS